MKQILFLALFGYAACASLNIGYEVPLSGVNQVSQIYSPTRSNQHRNDQVIPIIRQELKNSGNGNYYYVYQTGNGIYALEQREVKGNVARVSGGFGYTAPNGQKYQLTYTADENGFHPHGDHIPTPPPIPDDILKSIEINKAAATRGILDDGKYKPQVHEVNEAQTSVYSQNRVSSVSI